MPTRLPPKLARGVLARKIATAASVPQLVIALTVALPFANCNGRAKSALQLSLGPDVLSPVLILPPFAVALFLACTTLFARSERRAPRRKPLLFAAVTLPFAAIGCGIGAFVMTTDREWPEGPLFGMLAVGHLLCLVLALRSSAWACSAWLACGHALAASCVAFIAYLSIVERNSSGTPLVGAFIFMAAYVPLVCITVLWVFQYARIARSRRRALRAG
jgi:hypothetical protein